MPQCVPAFFFPRFLQTAGLFLTSSLANYFTASKSMPLELPHFNTLFQDLCRADSNWPLVTAHMVGLSDSPRKSGPPYSNLFSQNRFSFILCPSLSLEFELLNDRDHVGLFSSHPKSNKTLFRVSARVIVAE